MRRLKEDRVLVELHRAAALAGRPGIVVPSLDLDLANQYTGSPTRTRDAIERIVQTERATKVRKDLLVLPDVTGRVNANIEELIDVVAPRPYLITGGRALEHHGLTNQHFFAVTVLVSTRVAPMTYRGERVVFVPTNRKSIWGGRGHPCFANPERVIIDVLSSTRYSVPFAQIISAISVAGHRDEKFLGRLFASARRFQSNTTARRIGLLVEEIFGPEAAVPFLELVGESRTPVLLRRGGRTDAPVDSKWRVIVNANTELEMEMG